MITGTVHSTEMSIKFFSATFYGLLESISETGIRNGFEALSVDFLYLYSIWFDTRIVVLVSF